MTDDERRRLAGDDAQMHAVLDLLETLTDEDKDPSTPPRPADELAERRLERDLRELGIWPPGRQ